MEKNILAIRLRNQQLIEPSFKTPGQLLDHMGIIQAQEPQMAKWAMGIRLPHLKEPDIEAAYATGDVLRTHVLRPTWHLVSPENIYWMLDLSAAKIKASARSRLKQLELDATTLARCNTLFEKALAGGQHLTREALCTLLEENGIRVNDYRSGHILAEAELDGILCSGPLAEKKHTYALLQERVPKAVRYNREESIARLAAIYFRSHGPATVADFSWWGGLSLSDARKGLEEVRRELTNFTFNGMDYWHSESIAPGVSERVHLIPSFDEYLISYKDRSAAMESKHSSKAFSKNGIFWPVIIDRGKAIGTWKREVKRNHIELKAMYFRRPNKGIERAVEKAAANYAGFLNSKIQVEHVSSGP